MLERLHRRDRLDRPGASQQVPDHRLGAAHRRATSSLLSEADLRRGGLRGVVLGRAGAVAVDVLNLLRRHATLSQRRLDRARGAVAFGMRRGRVIAVGRQAVAQDLGQHRGVVPAREVLAHQHQHAAALSQRESFAIARIRRRGLRRERLQRVEPGIENVREGVRAAGQHRVGLAAADQLAGIPDRVGAGRARGVDREHGAAQAEDAAEGLRHRLRRDQQHQPGVRLLASLAPQVPLLPGEQSGVAGADHDAPAIGGDRPHLHATAGHRLLRRLDREIDCPVVESVGAQVAVLGCRRLLDLAAQMGAEAVHRHVLHVADRHATVAHAVPEILEGIALRGDRPHPSDDDAMPLPAVVRHDRSSV